MIKNKDGANWFCCDRCGQKLMKTDIGAECHGLWITCKSCGRNIPVNIRKEEFDGIMIVIFTEEEYEYIVQEFNNWHIKDDCPEELKATIKHKLDLLYNHEDDRRIKK